MKQPKQMKKPEVKAVYPKILGVYKCDIFLSGGFMTHAIAYIEYEDCYLKLYDIDAKQFILGKHIEKIHGKQITYNRKALEAALILGGY